MRSNPLLPRATRTLSLFAMGLLAMPALAQITGPQAAPAIARAGQNLGQEAPSTPLTLTVWLNLHNRAELDAKVKALYTKGSPSYHQWLKAADLQAYAPTASEVAAVQKELKANNLEVQSVDPWNLSVRFTGKTSDVERAFGTTINRYTIKGQVTRVSTNVPQLQGAAAGLVHHLAGLNLLPMHPHVTFPVNPRTGKKFEGIPVSASTKASGLVFSSQCFNNPSDILEAGVNASKTSAPVDAAYAGLTYGTTTSTEPAGSPPTCAYDPAEVQHFYGIDTALKAGVTGAGQTLVIIDSYEQPQAKKDLATFNEIYGLPAMTSSTFEILNPYGANQPGSLYGTDEETDLDIEWAHASAPGAKITLLESFSEDEEDQQAAIAYAVTHKLGNVISMSYGYPEFYSGPFALEVWNDVIELGAAEGIAFNASTGDAGDDSSEEGAGYTDVDAPADSPYATAVGGTSVALLGGDGGTKVQTGWGTNLSDVITSVKATEQIADPPSGSFYGGSGGGASTQFAKPAYQSALPGTMRMLPDVSALADPYTGAEFVYTYNGQQVLGAIGGTSLATPIFSGIWTLLNEVAIQVKGAPLGQAAPFVASTVGTFIDDVLPVTGGDNVQGVLLDQSGLTQYSAAELAQPLFNTVQFTSALWQYAPGSAAIVTFGTDSSLTTTQGWDNVTGYGTPDLNTLFTSLEKAL